MTTADWQKVFARSYRPTIVVICVLAGGSWAVVGAVGRFTTMVDERSLKVVESFAAKPLAEHEEFKRQIVEHERIIREVVSSQQLMDRNLTRLQARQDEQDRRGGTIPVQASGIVR